MNEEPTHYINKDLRGYSEFFKGKDLTGVDFRGSDISGCDFSKAILVGANFSNCDLRGTNFSRTVLTGANFEQATMGISWMTLFFSIIVGLPLYALANDIPARASDDDPGYGLEYLVCMIVCLFLEYFYFRRTHSILYSGDPIAIAIVIFPSLIIMGIFVYFLTSYIKALPKMFGTSFRNADLNNATFSHFPLRIVDFTGAIISQN
jgi:uncharacterized protein YjbI with pentapeptide repeats